MPSIISKYLRENGVPEKLIGNRESLSKVLIASSLILYGCKISYPIIKKVCHSPKSSPNDRYKNANGIVDDKSAEHSDNNNKICVANGNLVAEKNHKMKNQTNDKVVDVPKKQKNGVRALVPGFDRDFIKRLYFLIKIMIPKTFCFETFLLAVHTGALTLRTLMSIHVANMEGHIVKCIVQKDVKNFSFMLLRWLAFAIPATFINSMIRYLECKLALSFRSRLVNHAYKMYFQDETYYRVSNIDDRIENADHRLTEDITAFATSVAHLYSHITKPLFDCALVAYALAKSSREMGAAVIPGPLLATVMITITGEILRIVSPKFGAMVAIEAERKAYLRHIHTRIITNAEEIAFYKGHEVELSHLQNAFQSLVRQKDRIFLQKLWYVVLEQFLMKYVWSGTGMVIVSLPILTGGKALVKAEGGVSKEIGVSERTQYFTTARNLLISGGDAVERLMSSYKEIVELAGYTYRVSLMFDVFDDVCKGKYSKRGIVAATKYSSCPLKFDSNGQIVALGIIDYSTDGSISLVDVPIVTPNGDVVVPSLTLKITPGNHLLITGPNGCGKSSLFRILSGLWPVYYGKLVKPSDCNMFYIPQRPYMSLGSLREQVIYPDTLSNMRKKGITDRDLEECLERVRLSYLITREGGWDATADWKDILSGGEKQRMAIARLFYHKPAFALLDECTSAVSMDVESNMYQAAKDAGITLLTITHRPSLWKFHTQILVFNGEGSWTLSSLNESPVSITEIVDDDVKSEKSITKTEN